MKMIFEVWNEQKCEWVEVDEEWMEGINVKGASEFNYNGSDNMIVIYNKGTKYEKHVSYERVFGSWGFPTTLA